MDFFFLHTCRRSTINSTAVPLSSSGLRQNSCVVLLHVSREQQILAFSQIKSSLHAYYSLMRNKQTNKISKQNKKVSVTFSRPDQRDPQLVEVEGFLGNQTFRQKEKTRRSTGMGRYSTQTIFKKVTSFSKQDS